MSIFICWSGDRSHQIAKALKGLLESSMSSFRKEDVFISDDIEKGVSWFQSIETRLETAKAGIVCLTPENLNSPWLHFEAGALARRLTAEAPRQRGTGASLDNERAEAAFRQADPPRYRLFTLLHGVAGAELRGPLASYQATSTTRSDVAAMIRSITSVVAEPHARAFEQSQPKLEAEDLATFEAAIKTIAVPARELIPGLESLFQRKTFKEPLHRCADQAWLRRYDGARLTRERLEEHLDRVRAACSAHERGVFEMLLAELDAYTMVIQALLLTPKTFQLGGRGELVMPDGVQTSCEQRRLAIRSLASLLLQPIDEPLREEAVRFMEAETSEERKMIVHRLEGEIRREREVAFEKAERGGVASWYKSIEKLTQERRPILFRESSWDLDRIYYYLLIQYFSTAALRWEKAHNSEAAAGGVGLTDVTPMQHDWLCAARDVEMEIERYRARSKGGSLMPLTYALVALLEIDRQEPPHPAEAAAAVQSALQLVDNELGQCVLAPEVGGPITYVLTEIRSAAAKRSSASTMVDATPAQSSAAASVG
jgi:hypothetical protein